MHNGGIGNFLNIKQDYIHFLRPDLYKLLVGSTDSEHAFLLFLHYLPKRVIYASKASNYTDPRTNLNSNFNDKESGSNCNSDDTNSIDTVSISYIFEDSQTLFAAFKQMICQIIKFQVETESKTVSLLNFAVTDGNTTLVSRIIVNTKDTQERTNSFRNENCVAIAPSLYFSVGCRFVKTRLETSFAEQKENKNSARHSGSHLYKMIRDESVTGDDVVIVASERLTSLKEDWVEVPSNHILLISNKSKVSLYSVDVAAAIKNCQQQYNEKLGLRKEKEMKCAHWQQRKLKINLNSISENEAEAMKSKQCKHKSLQHQLKPADFGL